MGMQERAEQRRIGKRREGNAGIDKPDHAAILLVTRGPDDKQGMMFTTVSPEKRVPKDHPLRKVKAVADAILKRLSPAFDTMYSRVGRPSIPPERLLKSMVLIALYSVRSERLFCEQLDYNMLFRWFLDSPASTTNARERQLELGADRATSCCLIERRQLGFGSGVVPKSARRGGGEDRGQGSG
jgi:transposase